MPQVPLDSLASCERGHVCDIKKRWADWLGYLAAGANGAAGKHAAGIIIIIIIIIIVSFIHKLFHLSGDFCIFED